MHTTADQWTERMKASTRKDPDFRSAYQVDYGRIVHSAAFRRLQGKTQILGLGESDFYRTRLTHSIEVAQIGEGIVSHLKRTLGDVDDPRLEHLPTPELIRAICLIHDIGHPPFGHGGEIALNRGMVDGGGFEGNGQSLRIVSRLEQYYKGFGMNLTRRTLLGVLKYPVAYSRVNGGYHLAAREMAAFKPPKCYLDTEQSVVAWMIRPFSASDQELLTSTREPKSGAKPPHRRSRFKGLDTSIMDTADDISYGIHDMEDGLALGFIQPNDFIEMMEGLRGMLPQGHWVHNEKIERELFENTHQRKKWISIFVGKLISGVELVTNEAFQEPVLRYNVRLNQEQKPVLDAFTDLVFRKVILNPNVKMADYKGQLIIAKLAAALHDEGLHLLPPEFHDPTGETPTDRLICDYIACMTDQYAGKLYQKLFQPNFGSVFDHL